MPHKVGTPTAPADPSTLEAAAEDEYQRAVVRTGGCATPLIVENELFGAGIPTPWSASTAQYRANVLVLDLAAKGAHPVLLINKSPFAGFSDAVTWWREVAKVSDIVREVYLPATQIWPLGPTLGNRYLRQSYRNAVTAMTSMGIPANRLGLMLSFLSHKGVGGRNGLEAGSAWYQVVKWEALSVEHVAKEVGLGSVFSWGWQEWNKREMDPNKPKAACVWLWARTPRLCNAPRMLGKRFDRSLTAGQILLPHGAVCRAEGIGTVGGRALGSLEGLTGDRDAAISALFERAVESSERPVSRRAVLAAQREVIRGSSTAERARISQRSGRRTRPPGSRSQCWVTRSGARDSSSRGTRRSRRKRRWPRSTRYPDLLVRRVHVSPAPPWLAGRRGSRSRRRRRSGSSRYRRGESPASRRSSGRSPSGRSAPRKLSARCRSRRCAGDRCRAARLRARAVVRALDDRAAEPRPEPDDLPPRPASPAGRDRPHGVLPFLRIQ